MIALSLEAAQNVREAISRISGQRGIGGCNDPKCCGGWYYDDETAAMHAETLLAWGIKIVE